MRTFKYLKDFLMQHKWKYFWGVIILILVDSLQLITPKILGRITDDLGSGTLSMKNIYFYVLAIITLALIIATCRFIWRILVMGSSRSLEYWLRNKYFAHLELMAPNFFNNRKTGDLMAHATNDINAVRMAFGNGIVMITDAVFLTSAAIIIMVTSIDIRITVLALLPLPVIAVLMIFFGKMIQNRFKNVQEAFSELTDKVQESISGIRVIKSFVQENSEISNFSVYNSNYLNKNMKLMKVWGLMFPAIAFIGSLSFLISLYYGGSLVIDDELSLGQFVSFIAYLGLLTWPMMALGWVINILQRGIVSMKRINQILDIAPEIFDGENALAVSSYKPSIQFNNLSFTYPGAANPALSGITLNIEEGKTLAVIGKTGSGKTTLVNLIMRLYNTEPGELLLDGMDINNIPLEVLRKNIGYVPQDNFLFSATIRENIAFSDTAMEMEKVSNAAKIAQVYDNIMSFPEKFETILGERGVTLSGGQKQRVAIARAIAKDPKIIILDDSLSAVDTKTEELIIRGLKQIMKSRTSIIVAHRVSTIKDADEIIFLDEGRIVERGTHEELVQLKGHYNSIYEKQQLEEKIEREA